MSLSKIGLLTAAMVLCCGVSARAQEGPKDKEVKKPAVEREGGEARREGGDREPRREEGEPGRPPRREGGEGVRPPRGDGEDGPREPRREGGEGRPPREGDVVRPRIVPRDGEGPNLFPRGVRPGGEEGGRQPFPGPGQERDPQMQRLIMADMELERHTRELAEGLRRSAGEEREKLVEHITEVVTKHFTIRQERREFELKRLEEQLQKLRESIAERTKSREAIIKRRIAELTGERDDMGF